MLHSKHTLREFDTALTSLKTKLIKMGNLCELALHQTGKSLVNRDIDLTHKIIADDEQIDQLETIIDHKGITILACYSPMAGDLRYTLVLIRLSSIFERIGDECVSIAKRAKKLIQNKEIMEVRLTEPQFQKMGYLLNLILNAIEHNNLKQAEVLLSDLDKLRECTSKLTEKLITLAEISDSSLPELAELILISRSLEKIATSLEKIVREFMELKESDNIA